MRSMVYAGQREMAMGPERSKPLHNFKLPYLKWGNQRYLRCMKLDDASTATDSSSSAAAAADHHRRRQRFQRRRSPPSRIESLLGRRGVQSESSPSNYKSNDCGRERRLRISKGEAAEGIKAVREKLMEDLKTAADKMKDAIFQVSDDVDVDDGDDEEEFEEPKHKVREKEKEKVKEREESPAAEMEARPWNLRTRRAACKAPIEEGGGTNHNNYNYSPMKNEVITTRVRPAAAALAAAAEKKTQRPKFSVALSKKEIEEDFISIAGHRPVRRPKKRPRFVQKQLDSLFPGLWLTEVTADSYKVPEIVETGKR